MVAVGLAIFTPAGGTSSRSCCLVRRQLDLVERVHVVILARHVPRHVRLVQADRQEERLVVSAGSIGRCRTDDLPLAQVFVLAIERGELDAADAGVARRLGFAAFAFPDSRPTRSCRSKPPW